MPDQMVQRESTKGCILYKVQGEHRLMENGITDAFGRPYPRENVLAGVGKGWHGLVNKLIDDLFELGWDGSLHQIKEKFGGLRFYIGGATEEAHERIHAAENESLRTCDECGEPGKPDNSGWIRTVCETHLAIAREARFVQDEAEREARVDHGARAPKLD